MTTGQNKKTIGITLGDPTGIGPEIVAKTIMDPEISSKSDLLVIGNPAFLKPFLAEESAHTLKAINPYNDADPDTCKPGCPNMVSAQAAASYLNEAIELLKNKKIDALATAPLSKEAICSLGIPFQGHTEFLADAFNVKKYDMLFVTKKLKVVVATRHIPLKDVSSMITSQKVLDTITLLHQSLTTQFRIQNPKIAVCGLNPHAGEGGKIGSEEKESITIAIQAAAKAGIDISGPFPADTVFCPNISKNFDAIIAMYHDQGLAPMKALCFDKLVNMTIGLPFVRTSPAHGTAYGIAGQNIASPASMIESVKLAQELTI